MADEACLNLRVGFAGALEIGEETELLEERLAFVYDEIGKAFQRVAAASLATAETVLDAHAKALPECAKAARLTLLTGYAEGADRISAAAWRGGEGRTIHAVFPYADGGEPDHYAWTHRPTAAPPEPLIYRIDLQPPPGVARGFDRFTVLDGDASQREVPPRSGHLEQTRFLVRWSDICVVAWAGNKARGPGGTADMVAFALAKEMPIIWIDLAEDDLPTRWISPQGLWSNVHFGEFVEALNPPAEHDRALARNRLAPILSPDELFETLRRQFMPPEDAGSHSESQPTESGLRLAYTSDRMPRAPKLWPIAKALSWLWRMTYKAAHTPSAKPHVVPPAGDAKATVEISSLIEAHFDKAEDVASGVGDAHRGTQLAILLLAVLAVVLATLPVLLEKWKWPLVLLELLAVGAAGLLHAVLKKFASHRIWSDARRIAERLRVLRATWPLGFDIADGTAQPPAIWTEWYACAIRRAAGPPQGDLGVQRLTVALELARSDPNGIVAAQARYHEATMHRSHGWHRRLEALERPGFYLFVIILASFLVAYAMAYRGLVPKLPAEWGHALVIISAFYPVFAGAMLAIEAKFHFQENSIKSKAFCRAFEAIAAKMAQRPDVSRSKELVWQAGRLLMTDVDQWRESADRRAAVAL